MGGLITDRKNLQCFICLGKIKILPTQTTPIKIKQGSDSTQPHPTSSSIKCLQHLFHYLKINSPLRKLLNGDSGRGNLRPENGKMELCEECIPLNNKFSKIYNQLEKIEMELLDCLQLIHRRLAEKGNDFHKNDKLIFALRKRTLQKCSNKLNKAVPRVKTKKLNWTHISGTKRKKIKLERSTHNDYVDELDSNDQPNFGTSNVDIAEYDIHHLQVKENESCAVPPEISSGEVEESSPEVNPEGIFGLPEGDESDNEIDIEMTREGGSVQSIPPPIKVSESIVRPQSSVDPKSGLRKCNLCSKKFATPSGLFNHHGAVHNKTKYMCPTCPAVFTQPVHYKEHYKNIHWGQRVSCNQCTKSFANRRSLWRHNTSFHSGKRYPCPFCHATFTNTSNRNMHMKLNCPAKPQ